MDKRLWVVVSILIVLLLIWLPSTSYGTDKNLTLLINIFTLASLASSWNFLGGYTGQISLGHAAFFGLGSLVTRQMWLKGEDLTLAFAAGGGAAALDALVVGIPALRLRGIYFSIGTLALAEACRATVQNEFPKISGFKGPQLRTYDLSSRYFVSLAVMVVIVAVVYLIVHSKIGLGVMAVREDEDAARAIGINTFLHKLFAFVLSALFAGMAGSSFAYYHVSYYPSHTFTPIWTFDALIITFIGGVGTLSGPLIGSVFFVFVRDRLASNFVGYHLLMFGTLFILVVLLLPGGLLEIWNFAKRQVSRFVPQKVAAPRPDPKETSDSVENAA
jgi:branched-chain amino acid transport system permease protein